MSQVTETKIELVTEAIEALVLATVVAATGADEDRALNHRNVVDARDTLKTAMREFTAPSLRIVAATETVKRVGNLSLTKRTVTSERTEIVPYGGEGIDGMNLA